MALPLPPPPPPAAAEPGKSQSISNRETAIHELIKGREVTTRLGNLLRENSGEGGLEAAGELVEEVLISFSKALAVLDSGTSPEVGLDPAIPCSGYCTSENSDGKRTIRPGGARRGGHRTRAHPYACSRVISKTINDGHTWRKYGQKEIHSSKYPRSYFRCTHKYDQGCQATRQLQKSEEDPSLFVITYMGQHTCTNVERTLQPSKGPSLREHNNLIIFGSYPTNSTGLQELLPPSSFPSALKQEIEEDVPSNLSNNGSSSEYLMLPELTEFEASLQMEQILRTTTSDDGDVISGVHSSISSSSLDFDFMEDESVLSLDQDGIFQNFECVFGLDLQDDFF